MPSMTTVRPSSIDFRISSASQALEVSVKSVTSNV
jgi:hypothetical protein